MMLEQQGGHQCTAYQNPVEAVAQYSPGQYEAVISDVRMPEMSGLEVSRKIQEITPTMPVILISGHEVQPEDRETICKCCCNFFSKPLRAGAVLEALKKLIGAHINHNSHPLP